jgi:hypothetical protein
VRITLDVSLTYERVTAAFDNGTVMFDEPAVVAWKLDRKGNRYVVGIGSHQLDRESATVEPALSQIRFDPMLAASIVSYMTASHRRRRSFSRVPCDPFRASLGGWSAKR